MPKTTGLKNDVVSLRLTTQQRQQVDELVQMGFGAQADVFRIAIDRMHQKETRRMNEQITNEQIWKRIETLTTRMDAAARKSSADPVIQKRIDDEVDELWREIQKLTASMKPDASWRRRHECVNLLADLEAKGETLAAATIRGLLVLADELEEEIAKEFPA